ncbi:MAG: glycosyltransferase family 2 protein, partial [Alphaproteobacteria bacterium]|nr:glycosyltransferase family 2 protein [Alphaproteobacteria bacterium]
MVQLGERYPDFVFTTSPGVSYRVHGAQHSNEYYGTSSPLQGHLCILEGVFERGREALLRSRAREVAEHLRRRMVQHPSELNSDLGERARKLCERLDGLAREDERALFSIILTTYNRSDLLQDALASVGSQTLRDFEVILINDNGEPVEHLLAAYDFPITYIRQGRNQGLSAARNAGLRLARGRFVVYLDDDDIYLPDHLAVLAKVFERQPWSVAYTGVEYVNERLERAERIELSRQAPFAHEEYDKTRLFIQNYIPVNTWAHPRSMLAEVGEFDTKLTAFEDWDMLLRLAARYHFVHVPQITAEVHLRDAPNTGSDHMLGREQKNFGPLYREMYRRHSDLDSDVVRSGRRAVLKRFGVSDLSNNHQPASLTDWLEMRVLTSTQERLVKERLEQNGQGPSFGVLLLDLKAERQEVLGTLASLGEPHNLYANIEPVVFTTSDSLAESFGGEIVNVTKANWVLQINTYLATARFDWLVLVKAGDEFTSAGLLMAGLELLGAADFRAIYCDELYRQDDGSLGAAFRPSMNLDYLLSFPAGMAQHWIFRREVLVEVGGFNPDYPEALEFELILRFVNVGGLAGIGHVDEPLLITSPPALVNVEEEQRIVIRHLHERGYKGASIDSSLPGRYLINYGHADKPLVSILISVEDQLPILLRCVTSVMENTRYANYEILLLEDSRASREVREWLIGIESMAEQRIRVLRFPEEAGQDAICNQ